MRTYTHTNAQGITVRLDIKRTIDDEVVVRWIQDGKRIEAKCYYTDDIEDARGTLEYIAARLDSGEEVAS